MGTGGWPQPRWANQQVQDLSWHGHLIQALVIFDSVDLDQKVLQTGCCEGKEHSFASFGVQPVQIRSQREIMMV